MSELLLNNIDPHGRKRIYISTEDITPETIIGIVNKALSIHSTNITEEEYLLNYRRGITPIKERKKERNKFVCNRITENHADEIVSFKNGYFLTQPVNFVSRNGKSQGKINKLNEYVYRSGKSFADNKVVDWFHTVGVGALYVTPTDDDECPIKCYALDPRSAFVGYSLRPGNEPVIGFNMVVADKRLYVDAYTKDMVYRLAGEMLEPNVMNRKPTYKMTVSELLGVEKNTLGEIPIIEYRYKSLGVGAFELALPLLDALNTILSNRLDGIEQFIQSLMVIYGSDLPDGEDASSMKKRGILVLPRSGDGANADVKILSEELNQEQTQTLVSYIYEQILTICSMPTTTKGGSSTSDTGAAVFLRDGWQNAQTCALNTEDLWKESNAYFEKILLKVLEQKQLLKVNRSDFEASFVRNETAGVYSKSQALMNLMTAGLSPELAFAKSGISNDPVSDVKASEPWLKLKWGDPTGKPQKESGEVADNELAEALANKRLPNETDIAITGEQ